MGLVRSGLEQIQFFLGQILVQTTERCLHKVPANVRLGKNSVELRGRVIVGPTAIDDVGPTEPSKVPKLPSRLSSNKSAHNVGGGSCSKISTSPNPRRQVSPPAS